MTTDTIDRVKSKFEQLSRNDIEYIDLKPSQLVVNLAVEGGYQRDPKKRDRKLRAIAEKFSPAALGMFHVWINSANQYETIDGAGRRRVCLELLEPAYDRPVHVCLHHHIKNIEQAARWFLILNADEITKVTDKDKFASKLKAKDADAIRIERDASAGGLVVGGTGARGISVQAAYTLDHLDNLLEVGLLKNTVWPDFKVQGPQWIALSAYLLATRDNSVRLREALKKHGPEALNAKMIERTDGIIGHARSTAARFARQILRTRNYAVKSKPVSADWKRVDDMMQSHPWSDRWETLD